MPKTLVIVESPTKAKTISKFLGKDYAVESSFGHIRDLPKSKMGIDIEGGTFMPTYSVPRDKSAQVKKLKEIAKKAKHIIFATDEDREGEAISWHLAEVLGINPSDAERIVFHEITKHAIEVAIKNPRIIDQKLVDAQQARRILDRLVGYELSPLLWKKVARGLSAGRVQSVAVRLVVEREREIQSFIAEEYWTITGTFEKQKNLSELKIKGELIAKNGKKLDKFDLNNQKTVDEVLSHLDGAKYQVESIVEKQTKRTPPPPFTTSTLQQQSNNRLGYSSKQTMRLAQQLYEGIPLGSEGSVGLITYMRTDSVNLSQKFLEEAREFVTQEFGDKYAMPSPRFYKTKSKGAQEAHEAIRPSDPARTPDSLKSYLTPQQLKLYTLIWKRAVSTQMAEARLNKTAIDIVSSSKESNTYTFRANGQTIIFDGWLTLYPELLREEMIPHLEEKEALNCLSLEPEQHFTEPPARYSDATLVKALEEYGIGRPSTYAPTIATIEARGYVEREDDKRLHPKDIAFIVNDLLVNHFPDVVNYEFTAEMEENLDAIAEGTKHWQPIIATFYHPFHETIVKKTEELTKGEVVALRELGVDPTTGKPIYVRIGRYGPFVQKGAQTDEEKPAFASLAKNQTAETVTLAEALQLFTLPRNLGNTPEGDEIIANIGRFGPYLKVKSKFYSLKEDDPYTIPLERALILIAEAKDKEAQSILKSFPGSTIIVKVGRYGPYITDGTKNAKIPKGTEPTELDQATCEDLIAKAPEKKARRFTRKKA